MSYIVAKDKVWPDMQSISLDRKKNKREQYVPV